MTELTHAARTSPWSKEYTYRFGGCALEWQAVEDKGNVSYSDVELVTLLKYPNLGHEQGHCILHMRSGKKIKLYTHHYRSFGSFDNRSATYTPFVKELCRRIAAANPNARFVAGSSAAWFFWMAWFIIVGLLAILFVMVVLGEGLPKFGRRGYISLILIPLLVLLGWKTLRRGRQIEFDPLHPPSDYVSF